jgi:hypothetical protein
MALMSQNSDLSSVASGSVFPVAFCGMVLRQLLGNCDARSIDAGPSGVDWQSIMVVPGCRRSVECQVLGASGMLSMA